VLACTTELAGEDCLGNHLCCEAFYEAWRLSLEPCRYGRQKIGDAVLCSNCLEAGFRHALRRMATDTCINSMYRRTSHVPVSWTFT
jgi:hypothetical protein